MLLGIVDVGERELRREREREREGGCAWLYNMPRAKSV
jgi:hypothetical protein